MSGSGARARSEVADWCAALAFDDVTRFAVQHGLAELVANVIEHAYAYDGADGSGRLRVDGALSGGGVLELVVADDGRWREEAAAGDDRGRGLALIRQLLDDVEIERGGSGTVARATHRPSRQVRLDTTMPPAAVAHPAAGFTVDMRENHTVAVFGAIDLLSVDESQSVLLLASEGGSIGITVDLSGVTLLGSAAISVLLQPWMRGARLCAPAGGAAQHILELVGIDYSSSLAG